MRRLAEELGCRYACEQLPGDAEEAEVLAIVGKLNADPRVSGILVLRPLPRHVDEGHVYRTLDPLKDIEAVHPDNAGLLVTGKDSTFQNRVHLALQAKGFFEDKDDKK